MTKKIILSFVTIILLPAIMWSNNFEIIDSKFMVDGIMVSSFTVFIMAVTCSALSYRFFSLLRSKQTSLLAYLLSIIIAEIVILPLDDLIGPTGGLVIGVATGFACHVVVNRQLLGKVLK